ncbi:NADPH-dependent FMN reductase [Nitrospira sp. Nam74]
MAEVEIKVIGLGGSLAQHSASLAALAIALKGAEEAGAQVELFDVRKLNLPMYDPDDSEVPEAARHLADAVASARGLLLSSPLYHGSVSGAFKNALDWLQLLSDRDPPFLTHKVVGLISVAGGVYGLQAVNTMEFVVRALRGWSVPLVIPIPHAWEVFDEEGKARDGGIERQLRALGAEVWRAARQFALEGVCDYAEGEAAPQEKQNKSMTIT